jgi:hypothetical protein
MSVNGCGEDEHGKRMAQAYLFNAGVIQNLMSLNYESKKQAGGG